MRSFHPAAVLSGPLLETLDKFAAITRLFAIPEKLKALRDGEPRRSLTGIDPVFLGETAPTIVQQSYAGFVSNHPGACRIEADVVDQK